MTTIKRFLTLSLIAALAVQVWGERVSLEDAAAVANNFMNVSTSTSGARRAVAPKRMVLKTAAAAQEENQYYVYENADGEGWVMVAANDIARPILAYSDEGHFRFDNQPSNVKGWLRGYNRQIRQAEQDSVQATEEVKQEWRQLRKGTAIRKGTPVVAALIQTKWDQDAPYWNQCPTIGSARCLTGCVATAMAQVMNYWQWPVTGTGSASVTVNGQNYSVDFSTGNYDWNNMLNKYSSYYEEGSSYSSSAPAGTTAQKNAVAKLMYHCGVAAEMEYGTDVSGAYTIYPNKYSTSTRCAQYALIHNFGYNSSTIQGYSRPGGYGYSAVNDATWHNYLKTELDAKRPIMYAGADNEGGHSFICDGYDNTTPTRKYHFNWGWSGYCDGYYDIDALVPGTGGSGAGNGSYNDDQDIIIGIMPPQVGHNINLNGTGCSLSADKIRVENGNSVTVTITPTDATYDYTSTTVQLGSATISSSNYTLSANKQTLTINGSAITGDASNALTITVVWTKNRYKYEMLGEHCTMPDDGMLNKNAALNLTITPDAGYTLADAACWDVSMGGSALTYGTGFTYNPGTGAFSIASVTGDVEILAYGGHTVTWSVQGINSTTTFADGAALVLPANPSDCSGVGGKKFVGWTANSSVDGSAPADLFTAAGTKTVTANTTYYAVYATASGSGGSSKTYTLELDGNNFAGSYAERSSSATANEDGGTGTFTVSFTSTGVMKSSNSGNPIQFRKSGSGAGVLYNTTDLGTINSITYGSGSTNNIASTYKGSTEQPTSDGTGGYFKITNGSSVSYITSISVNFTKTTGGGTSYSDYSLTCSTCTLTGISVDASGATTSFVEGSAFSSEGIVVTASYSDCSDRTVSPTSVTPPDMSVVGNGQTVTVSYTEGTETKNATYTIDITAAPTYAIRFFNNAEQVGATQNLIAGAVASKPSPDPTACEGYTFVGWWTAALAEDNTTTYSWVTDFTVTGDQDYYAVFSKTEGGGGGSSKTYTLTLTGDNFVQTYNERSSSATANEDGGTGTFTVNFTSTGVMKSSNSGNPIQFRKSGSGAGVLYNTTDLGTINSITYGSGSTNNIASTYKGSTEQPTSDGTGGYFKITNGSSVSYITSITINFTKNTGGGGTTYYTTAPSCVECTNKVTLTKGTPSNGSFSIDKADGEYDNCSLGGLVLHVSDITPAAGYEFGAITQTGIASGVTIDQVNKTVTYAKDVTGSSTINVTFNALPTYAIRFFNNGSQVGATQNLIAGATATKPSPDPTACEGYTFVGWWTAALAEDNTTTYSWVTDFTVIGAQDYYAVYSQTVGGGGSSKTYTLELDGNNFAGSYAERSSSATANEDGGTGTFTVSFTSNGVMKSSNSGNPIQFRKSGSGAGVLYNTTDLGTINSITYGSGSTNNIASTYKGSTEQPTSDGTGGYFKITNGSSVSYITSISINFTKSTGSGGTTYYTTQPTCVECTNKVNLTKGTPSNGSFSIDKADGEYDNCSLGGLVLHVSDITPAAGYEFGAITQTGIASGVTIDQVNKTVTYAKDVTGSSTINVTFNALPTYAIRFFNNGSQVGATQNLIAGATATKPSPDPTACEGYTFVGWWTANLAEDNTTTYSWVTDFTVTGAQDYYAVYSLSDGEGGEPSTINFAKADFSGSGTISASKSGVTVSCVGNIPSGGYVTFTEGNELTITSSSGNITTIDFTCSSDEYTGNMTDVSGISSSSWSITVDNPGAKTTVRVSGIAVTVGGGGTTYYTTAPECVECTNKVTLTKGEETNGTFTLNKADGAYNNCTSNFVVTVSNITPESGYYCTGVTATGGHNTVTGPDGSGNYTVTYTKGNNITSTITANFAPNPKYTVTWSANGDDSYKVQYEEGESIAFPASATGCDGKVFRGWSAETVAETDVEPSYVTSATMPAHNVTYYAVYAEESGSGGTPSSESYSFTNKSWHASEGNWTSGQDGAGYNNSGVQVTASASGANATCPNSYSNISSIVVSYCTNGSSGAGSITMGIGSTSLTNTITKTGGTTARNTTFDFSGTSPTGNPHITVTCTTNSIYICGVTIYYGSSATYTGYTTSCGAGISAKNIGWITTTKGQKVKRVINVSAKNFDEATTLAATCANSHFEVTLGATAVPAGPAGLTTTLTVEYTPADFGARDENVEIELTAGDKSKTITVSGRSLPEEFVIITKKNSKWYALPANMATSGEHDGVEVSPNDATTPTVVPVSPSNAIYSLASVADSRYADNGHCVRLVGNDNLCLWSNMGTSTTKTHIQNKTQVATAATDNHDWLLSTTDGVHYTIANPHHPQYGDGRRLAYGTKFGMFAEETEFFIVSAGCSSQPGEVAVSPRRVEATFSWVSNASSMTIDLYTNELMTEGHKTATASSSPYIFTGLEESTPYWYKLTPGTDSDCAVTGSFTTTGPAIDIVEWQENGVVLFIDNGEEVTPMIVIDGQEEHGSITGGGGDATELFFAKYFEGAGSMKLVSVFNGTKNDISLSNYTIFVRMRGSSAWAPTNDVTLDLSSLGSIKAGQEIIFFSRPLASETGLAGCSNDFLNDKVNNHSSVESNPRWVECDGGTFKRINFNGNDPILLQKSGTTIDIIGSEGAAPTATNCLSGDSEKGWGGTVRNMDKGKSPSHPDFNTFYEASSQSPVTTQDSIDLLSAFGINLTADEISLTTARCIFFRDKRITCGDSAVLMNGSTFVTFTNHDAFTSEWYGRSVCMNAAARTAAGVSDDAQATCNSYQDIANMDYNEYYLEWHNIDPGTSLEDFTYDPATNEYIIPIDNMRQYACLNLRFQLVQGDNVLTEATQQVPIIVKGNVDTNDPLFSELVIDQSTHLPSYTHSVERCKNCDVIVLGSASLTKGNDADANDVPEVGNVKVYPGGQLIVPSGTTYKMKSLALRRQEDVAASANIVGDITFSTPAPAPARKDAVDKPIRKTPTGEKKTYLDLRVDPTNWHYISLPYDCDVADIRYANPEETDVPVLGTDYLIKWYNGEKRAATQSGGCWEMVASDATLKAGLGYIFSIPGDGKVMREFRFPMDNEVIAQEKADKMVNGVYSYGGDQDISIIRANHRGWNLLGNPYLMPYSSDITDPLMTGYIVPDYPSDPEEIWDGHYKFDPDPSTNLRYIVEPIDNGWSGYTQVTIASYEMKPFTSYFVQIGGDHPEDPQGINFHVASVSHSPVRRAPAEYEEVEDRHPVWCAVTLTNPKGEKDETTLLISDNFTDGYDMMDDLTKWRGTYYQYAQITTAPVLASRNNEGEMAFNALPDSSALAGVPLNYFAASQGFYTIAYDDKYDRDMEVKEVKLWDKTTNQWYNLMYEPYSFSTARTDNKDRFVLSVRVERKQNQTTTDLENVGTYKGDKPRKLLINGLLYIQRGKDVYDVTGKQLLNR